MSPNMNKDSVITGFTPNIEHHDEEIHFESECLLKTKTDKYKEHWGRIIGNELFCYRHADDPSHRVMHSLVGTFLKEQPPEYSQSEKCQIYSIKIMLPPNKSRLLYFK